MSEQPIILHSFALSHYCENVRWALDFKRVPYTEKSWAPMLHMARTWRMRKRYTPVLRVEGRALQESADICDYLEERFPDPSLVPEYLRTEIRAAADDARSIGPHVRRLAYLAVGRDPDALKRTWAMNVGHLEARFHGFIFPLSRRMVFKGLRVNDEEARKSEVVVREFLERRDSAFGNGRRYLVGDTFTLADLTLASMLSPLARPKEHPFYSEAALDDAMQDLVDSFRGSETLAWVQDCYARHRVV